MDSPLSPVVANIFMENFANRAITTFRRPPKIWKRYVDNIFVILSKYAALSYLVRNKNITEATLLKVSHDGMSCEITKLM